MGCPVYTNFDIGFKKYLTENGVRYLITGLSVKEPHCQFWVYVRTEEFELCRARWYAGNNTK